MGLVLKLNMYKKTCLNIIFLFILSYVFAGAASAANITWDGGGGDDNWSTGANWVGDVAPGSSDVAVFNATSTDNSIIDSGHGGTVSGINIQSGYTGTITVSRSLTMSSGNFSQAAGTFNGSNQTILLDGTFALSGGIFTSTSGTFTILNNFTVTGGTFNHNSGTIGFSGTGMSVACNSITFNRVTIVMYNFFRTITIGSACTIPLGSSPTVQGTIVNNGTITSSGNWTSESYGYQGNTGSTLNLTTATSHTATYSFYLNGGTFTAPSLTSLTVDNSLTLSTGIFPATVTTLTVGSNLNNSGNLLPNGINVTLNAGGGTFTCGTATYGTVTINKTNNSVGQTIASSCNITVTDNPTGTITNNGTITMTDTTVDINGGYTGNSGSTLSMPNATTWNISYIGFTLDGGTISSPNLTTIITANRITLTSGTFPQTVTTITTSGGVINSGNLLPNNITLSIVGNVSDSLNCGNATFNSITINRSNWSISLTPLSNCTTGNLSLLAGNIPNPASAYTWYTSGNFTSTFDTGTTGGANLTFEFTGTSNQTASKTGNDTFQSKFRINKTSGTVTLTSNFTVTTQTCIVSDGRFDLDGYTFTCAGGFTVNDELALHGNETVTTPTLGSSSDVYYQGDDDNASDNYTIKNWSYYDMTISSLDSTSDAFFIPASITVLDMLTIDAGAFYQKDQTNNAYDITTYSYNQNGGTFNGSTGTLDISDNFELYDGIFVASSILEVGINFINDGGTFTHNSGHVILDGTNQTLSGSTTFYNFTKSVSTAATLTLPITPATQTFVGEMTWEGASGQLLSIRSQSSGTQALIDAQGARTVSYLDLKDNYNINATEIDINGANVTDSGNNTGWGFNDAPVASTPTFAGQATDGSGYVTFSTAISDQDLNNTKLKIEYSEDGGSTWYDPFLVSVNASSGTVDLDNAQSYQIGSVNTIDTSGGSVTLTITWNTQSASNQNGSLDDTNQSDIRVRVTPSDNTLDGSVATSVSFSVDNQDPVNLDDLVATPVSISEVSLNWANATEVNFNHYEIWYGTNSTDVSNRTGTASEWDDSDDSDLANATTDVTSIGSLTPATLYYFKIWAVDDYGNEVTTTTASATTIADNASPEVPTSLGPTAVIDGGWERDTTPTFTFSLSDSDISDQVKYRIQIDDTSDFSSPIVDYTSALAAQGLATFTVGQAVGSGSYTIGSAGQVLTDANYYWRVKTIDDSSAESAYTTANSGSIAFKLDATVPTKPGTPRVSGASDGETTDDTPKWTWSASDDESSGVDFYEVTWSTDNDFDDDVDEDETDSTSYTNDNLNDGEWYFRVRSRDNAGNYSSWSSFGSITIDATAPEITNITYTAYTNKIDITWKTNEEVGTKIDWGTTTSYGNDYDDSDVTTSHSATLSNLSSNTTYYIQITAEDELGNITQSRISVKTAIATVVEPEVPNTPENPIPDLENKPEPKPAPTEPTSLEPTIIRDIRAVTDSDTQVTITWTTNHPATSEVDFGLSTNFTEQRMDQTKKVNHKIVISGLEPQTTYYYEIISVGNTTAVNAFRTFSTKDIALIPVQPEAGTSAPTESITQPIANIIDDLFGKEGVFGKASEELIRIKTKIKEANIPVLSSIIDSLDRLTKNPPLSISSVLLTSAFTLAQLAGPNLIGTMEALRSVSISNWSSIIAGLFKKRKNPWGVVYDNATNEPLDPVVLTLTDKAGKTYQAVSDIYGRYEFLVEPGEYYLKAEKSNYIFPPQTTSSLAPGIYEDNYLGGLVTISKDQKVSFNLPMENVTRDWNQEEKRRMGISAKTNLLYVVANALYYGGFIWSFIALLLNPILLNLGVFCFYVVLSIYRKIVIAIKPWGLIKDSGGNLVKGAVVRLVNADIPQLKFPPLVTNSTGKYNFLVEKGNYRIGIQRQKSDGTYEFAYKSKVISTNKAYDNIGFDVKLFE